MTKKQKTVSRLILSLLMAFILCLGMAMPAYASEGPVSNGGVDDLPYAIIVMIVIIVLAGYVIYMYHKKPEDEE